MRKRGITALREDTKVKESSTGQNQETPAAMKAASSAKKPYVKPTVRHERVFETMALSCGKVQSSQGSCRFNRRAS